MDTSNYKEKIKLYKKLNSNLTFDEIGILLTIDNLYRYIPDEINITAFRRICRHLNPEIISREDSNGIKFLGIIKHNRSKKRIQSELNDYINIKFNHMQNFKTYEENMVEFKKKSKIVSTVINNILKRTRYPSEIVNFFKERECVRNCYDFYDLIQLYKNTDDKIVKYEILRRVGLIILISRVSRTFIPSEIEHDFEQIQEVFLSGLGITSHQKKTVYFFFNQDKKLIYSFNKKIVEREFEKEDKTITIIDGNSIQQKDLFFCNTRRGNKILAMDFRNKLSLGGKNVQYTSVVEKIIRKNLEFPTQIHDMLGARIVVNKQDDVFEIINELETFLGGSSTRKKEKNTINKFGKKKIGRYSSKDYFVWKAVYDITLPHHGLKLLNELREEFIDHIKVQKKIDSLSESMSNISKDVIAEIQIQDIESYLLGVVKKSSSNHDVLKMNQVKKNSFYKLFPREIYESGLVEFKMTKILGEK